MRIIFNLISIFIIVSVIFLASLNAKLSLDLVFWFGEGTKTFSHNLNLSSLIFFIFVAGILAGVFWASSFYVLNNKKLKEYQRKLEKTSVQTDEESSKVSVLEEKIKVLEKALENALNQNN